MEYEIKVDWERVPFGTFAYYHAIPSVHHLKSMVACWLVDPETNKYITQEQAIKHIESGSIAQLMKYVEESNRQMRTDGLLKSLEWSVAKEKK